MDFDRCARDGTDAQDLQCRAGGGLLALFDGAALAGGYLPAVHGDPGREARAVSGPLLGDYAVRGSQAVGLERLLQERLPVAQLVGVHLGGVEDLVYRAEDEVPIDQVSRPDYCFHGVGDDRVVYDRALDHLLEPLAPPYRSQEGLPHQVGSDARQVTLQEFRVAVEDQLRHPAVQNRIPEKFQPPVRVVGVGDARMRQRALPQRLRQDSYEVLYRHFVLYSTPSRRRPRRCDRRTPSSWRWLP